jgi:hypothetical protein
MAQNAATDHRQRSEASLGVGEDSFEALVGLFGGEGGGGSGPTRI